MTIARSVASSVAGPVARSVVGGSGGLTFLQVIADAVGYWPLQDDAASTVVVNDNGTDGALVGGDNTADISTTGPGGIFTKALALDGVSDWVDTNQQLTLAGNILTIAGWVDISGGAGQDMLITQGFNSLGGWAVYHDTSGRVTVGSKRSGNSSSHYTVRGQTDIRGSWLHIIAELDYTTATPSHRVWLDNAEESYTIVDALTGTYGDQSTDCLIGSRGSSDNTTGSIAGFAIWNRSLTSNERSIIYDAGVTAIRADSTLYKADSTLITTDLVMG